MKRLYIKDEKTGRLKLISRETSHVLSLEEMEALGYVPKDKYEEVCKAAVKFYEDAIFSSSDLARTPEGEELYRILKRIQAFRIINDTLEEE